MGFEHIPGNQPVKKALNTYLNRQKIPSSMIFAGPEGAYQLEIALALAQTINCLESGRDPQRQCRNCRAIERRLFPDVRVMNPEGQFYKKSQLDELIGEAILMPVSAQKKMFILRDAHRMNENSANAFLKTLEEPTSSTIFILITSNLSMILPTIRSRCQVLNFYPLSHAELKEELIGRGVDPQKASLYAFYPRFVKQFHSVEDWQKLDERRDRVFTMLGSLFSGKDVEDVLLTFHDRSRNRESFLEYFTETVNLISVYLRDIMLLLIDRENRYIANFDYRQQMIDLLDNMNMDDLFFLIRKMEMLLRDVQRNLNVRVLIMEFIHSFTTRGADRV